jgi:hypothetical protein
MQTSSPDHRVSWKYCPAVRLAAKGKGAQNRCGGSARFLLLGLPFHTAAPLRGMPLLSRPTLIRRQDPIDDPGKPLL